MALIDRTISGFVWAFFESIARRGVGVATTIVLSWFLVPEDFGLIGMVVVFYSIANSLVDQGLGQGLIRKKSITEEDSCTLFYSAIAISVAAYLIIYLISPVVSEFYDEPRLVPILRAVGVVVIVNAFQQTQVARLSHRMDFKVQLGATVPAVFLSSLVAIVFAVLGFGVWSLVAQIISTSVFFTLFIWWKDGWRPKALFSVESFRELFGFGVRLTAAGIIDVIFRNIYVVIIAKLFSTQAAGYYFFSFRIQQLVVQQLTNAIQKVSYPALSSIRDDTERAKRGYRKIVQIVTFVAFPALLGLAVLAEPLFERFLKQDWQPAAPYLKLLCISGLMYPLNAINLNILKVKGRSDLFLRLELIKKAMLVIVLAIAVPYGIYGILVAQIVFSIISYIPNGYYSSKLIGYGWLEQMADFLPNLVAGLFMGAGVYLISTSYSNLGVGALAATVLAGIVMYIGIGALLRLPAQGIIRIIILQKLGYG